MSLILIFQILHQRPSKPFSAEANCKPLLQLAMPLSLRSRRVHWSAPEDRGSRSSWILIVQGLLFCPGRVSNTSNLTISTMDIQLPLNVKSSQCFRVSTCRRKRQNFTIRLIPNHNQWISEGRGSPLSVASYILCISEEEL